MFNFFDDDLVHKYATKTEGVAELFFPASYGSSSTKKKNSERIFKRYLKLTDFTHNYSALVIVLFLNEDGCADHRKVTQRSKINSEEWESILACIKIVSKVKECMFHSQTIDLKTFWGLAMPNLCILTARK